MRLPDAAWDFESVAARHSHEGEGGQVDGGRLWETVEFVVYGPNRNRVYLSWNKHGLWPTQREGNARTRTTCRG
jgi:hypothetical protein